MKMKKVIDKGKRSKTLNEVKPIGNLNKNWQSFLHISPRKMPNFLLGAI